MEKRSGGLGLVRHRARLVRRICSEIADLQLLASPSISTYPLIMFVVREASKSVRALTNLYPSFSLTLRHPPDGVPLCAAHPSCGPSGWSLATSNARIGYPLRSIRCCCHRWRCVRARIEDSNQNNHRLLRRTWWLRGCYKGRTARSQGAYGSCPLWNNLIHHLFSLRPRVSRSVVPLAGLA
jgi:hypothetical protein